jgi:hypothetical protein
VKKPSIYRPEQSAKARAAAPQTQFALPATRAYWIPNLMHAKLAIGEAKKFATKAQRKKIAAAVTRDFPSLKDRAKKLAK